MRWLLVEAALTILRSKSADTAALRAWTLQIAQRRGKRIAVAALGRRLAGILYAMWRDDVAYDAHRIRPFPPVAYQRAGKAPHDQARIELTESGLAEKRTRFPVA
jgi:hypothetical protein